MIESARLSTIMDVIWNICLGCWIFSGCRKGGCGMCLEVGLWSGGVLSGYVCVVAARTGSSSSGSSSGSTVRLLSPHVLPWLVRPHGMDGFSIPTAM